MTELNPKSAREALKAVIDPEIYQNIVDLGLVYDIYVDEANAVDVSMTLTTPHCPMGPQIMHDVETVLRRAGASDVAIHIVWEPMWTPDAMTDELKRELGILEDEYEEDEEVVVSLPPPPPTKKKGFFGRMFGG